MDENRACFGVCGVPVSFASSLHSDLFESSNRMPLNFPPVWLIPLALFFVKVLIYYETLCG